MSHERPEIETWLSERGYPPEAIEKIMERLDRFDDKVNRDSLFDAISTGEVDMDAIIKEALAE
jgi:hypothetical protein